jgi:hypothetical protein
MVHSVPTKTRKFAPPSAKFSHLAQIGPHANVKHGLEHEDGGMMARIRVVAPQVVQAKEQQ